MAPKSATPIDPPTERKKLTVDVATPRSATRTEFWVARTRTCMVRPSPMPSTAMYRPDTRRLVDGSIVDSRNMPKAAMAVPVTGRMR